METNYLSITMGGLTHYENAKKIAKDNVGLNEEQIDKLLKYNKKLKEDNSEFRISFLRTNDNENTINKELLLNIGIEVGSYNLQKDKDFVERPRGIGMEESANALRAFEEFKRNFYMWYDIPLDVKIEMQSIEDYKNRKRYFRKHESEYVDYRNTLPYRESLESIVKHWLYRF